MAYADLIILAADKNMEYTIKGFLTRGPSLRIRSITYDILVHPDADPGCLLEAANFLRPFTRQYEHALVIFDHEGCGREYENRQALESLVEHDLATSGWDDRAGVIVIQPELEIWIWSASPHVDEVLGWKDKNPDLRTWLQEEGFLEAGKLKPNRPKEAMEAAMKKARKPRSSAYYRLLAEKVALGRCSDPSMGKLTSLLRSWYPVADDRRYD